MQQQDLFQALMKFDEDDVSYDYALKEVRDRVARWIDVELQMLEMK